MQKIAMFWEDQQKFCQQTSETLGLFGLLEVRGDLT